VPSDRIVRLFLPGARHWTPRVLGLLFVLAGCQSGGVQEQTVEVEARHVRVIATHDFHGALRPTAYAWSDGRLIGGAAALSAVMDTLELACACATLRIDGGDQMQGSLDSNLVHGRSVVALFNYIGLDAAAVGNHELDWGVDTLLARQSEASYAWLAANVFDRETGERPAWAKPFTVIDRGGVRVGIVGYATIRTPHTLRPETTEPYEFRAGYGGIRDALESVWLERPDFVLIVAHAGGDCGTQGCAGEMVELAAELPTDGVHLIVGGHAHTSGVAVVNGIPIVRAGANGRAVYVVDLYRLNDGTHAFGMVEQPVYADGIADDRGIASLLEPYFARADSIGSRIVSTLSEPLTASAMGDRRLGNLIADAVRLFAQADVGMYNPGGVRSDLPQGAISYADLHRVLPFDNKVVRVTLRGRQLRDLVEQVGPRYYFSNLYVERESGQTVGMGLANGVPIADEAYYSLATIDFLADGGDGLSILTGLERENFGIDLLDAVVRHLEQMPVPILLPREIREIDRGRR
jgi:2',3'-cyclic-nucleotide 2'-phosphodiesterase / 3'-nucleotidase / 5'-nucleotidase